MNVGLKDHSDGKWEDNVVIERDKDIIKYVNSYGYTQ